MLAYESPWLLDPRLTIPQKRPLGPCVIDWRHPLAEGLQLLVMPNYMGNVNLVNRKPPSAGPNNFSSQVNGPGVVGKTLTDLGAQYLMPRNRASVFETISVTYRFFRNTYDANASVFVELTSNYNNYKGSYLLDTEGGKITWGVRTFSYSNIVLNSTYVVSVWHTITATYDPVANLTKLFVDGAEPAHSHPNGIAADTLSTDPQMLNLHIFARNLNTVGIADYLVDCVMIHYGKLLTLEDNRRIHQFPYDVVVPAY